MHAFALDDERNVVEPTDIVGARDRDLIRRVGEGDREAFRSLFSRYGQTAMALALRVLRQYHLAEETVQEAFLSVWRDPGAYDPERGTVRAWLMSAVHNRAVDLVRREEAQRRRADEAIGDVQVDVADPAEAVVEEIGLPQERAAVREALASLPGEQRKVIELMYYDGMSQSRIADELALPLGTVKSRTLLGMRRLRMALAGLRA
jgi:RNA polymerase sigma-70 factor (ECF subfamily)